MSWLSFEDRAGGGKLLFHGTHYLDVIQYLVGDSIREVTGFCQNVGGQPSTSVSRRNDRNVEHRLLNLDSFG